MNNYTFYITPFKIRGYFMHHFLKTQIKKPNDKFSLFAQQINELIKLNEREWICHFLVSGSGFEDQFVAIITYYKMYGIEVIIQNNDLLFDITELLEEKIVEEEIGNQHKSTLLFYSVISVIIVGIIILILNYNH
jgi:hypothetical protein